MEHVNALSAGTRLREYEIEGVFGRGGFGMTYRAVDTHLHKVVAVKEYLPRDFTNHPNTPIPYHQPIPPVPSAKERHPCENRS